MATQVETLLPGNPLAKAEEHGKVIRGEPEEEGGRGDGAKRQTGVADQGSSSSGSGGSSPGQGGTPGAEEQTPEKGKEGCDSDDKQNEEGVKGRKEFPEAPPPKVNPWTRKMNAVTVVSVNGQAHHGSYPSPHLNLQAVSVVFAVCTPPGVIMGDYRAAVTCFRLHY